MEEALLFMECQQIIIKSYLFLKSCMTRDNAGCLGLCRPARFCTSSRLFFSLKTPWHFSSSPKVSLLLALARTRMEALSTAQQSKGVLSHSSISVWRYWSWHLTDVTQALGPVLILFGHCKVTAWSGWNCTSNPPLHQSWALPVPNSLKITLRQNTARILQKVLNLWL